MDYKDKTTKLYDRYASKFSNNTRDYLKKHIFSDANLFLESLDGRRILDLGSGPGRDSAYFLERGFDPLCLDISPEMVALCRDKGLNAEVGDLENLSFEDGSFNGVWAYTSLLHIPKRNFSEVLHNIGRILSAKGVFYIGMKKGNFEGFIKNDKYPSGERFFSLYGDRELRGLISERFRIVNSSSIELGDACFLNYLCLKKSLT